MTRDDAWITAYTLAIGAAGALAAYLLRFPVYLLTGPALAVSLISLTGLRVRIAPLLRNIAFLFIGVGIGTSVDATAREAFLRWPLAFLLLGVMLVVALWSSARVLSRLFGFDAKTGVLAATPGHLTFVIGLAESTGADSVKISVTQSVRILALTLIVPFASMLMGVDFSHGLVRDIPTMSIWHLLGVVALAIPLGLLLIRLRVPAGLLIGAMIVSSVGHLSELTPGTLTPYIALPCFVVVGTLIGSRFSGVTVEQLRRYLAAGLSTTLITVGIALLFAIPLAPFLNMPLAHVLVAFAPGGLETMIAMGAVLGANPGFVAACHVGRLLFLTVLVPAMLMRVR